MTDDQLTEEDYARYNAYMVVMTVIACITTISTLSLALTLGDALSGAIPPQTLYARIHWYLPPSPYNWTQLCIMPKRCKNPELVVFKNQIEDPDLCSFETKIEIVNDQEKWIYARASPTLNTSLVISRWVRVTCSNRKEHPTYVYINMAPLELIH